MYNRGDCCFYNEPFTVLQLIHLNLHLHGLVFMTSILFWQNQPDNYRCVPPQARSRAPAAGPCRHIRSPRCTGATLRTDVFPCFGCNSSRVAAGCITFAPYTPSARSGSEKRCRFSLREAARCGSGLTAAQHHAPLVLIETMRGSRAAVPSSTMFVF